MKVTINTTEPQSREVDWSKPMLVTDGKNFVLTMGEHSEICFSGTTVDQKLHSTMWRKSAFTPCTSPVTITFENEL